MKMEKKASKIGKNEIKERFFSQEKRKKLWKKKERENCLFCSHLEKEEKSSIS